MSVILAILFFILQTFFFSDIAYAKSYTIDDAQIEIQIDPDGSAQAKETRTYTFDGHFENGEWNIDISRNSIDPNSVTLSENGNAYKEDASLNPGTYTVIETGDKLIVKWKYSAEDEIKKFTISYKILDAVKNYSDTAEFYWKFIGDGWAVPTQRVDATVILPHPAPDTHLKAWGHGPLNGQVSIVSPTRINFSVSDLPSNTFMEGRVIFPPLSAIPQSPEAKLDQILAEENDYIQDTIRQVERMTFRPLYFVIFLGTTATLYLLRLRYWFKLWLAKGREIPPPQVNLSGTLHEPPSDIPPALVDALLSFSYLPSTNSITATILDLCRKKIIRITQEKQSPVLGIFPRDPEIIFEVVKPNAPLSEIEDQVIRLLYLDDSPRFSRTEILSKIKNDTSRLTHWTSWQEKVKAKLINDEYLEKDSAKLKSRLLLDIFLSGIFVVPAIFTAQFLGIFDSRPELIIFGLIVQSSIFIFLLILIYITMDKKTPKGAVEASKWQAFKKYLKDYSVTKNYPLESVIIWEKYIVYGSALGISLKALSELPVKFTDSTTSSSFIYAAGISDGGRLDFGSLTTGFNTLSSSYGASGSGSSGGFSGGGGGGGGGSGGGMS